MKKIEEKPFFLYVEAQELKQRKQERRRMRRWAPVSISYDWPGCIYIHIYILILPNLSCTSFFLKKCKKCKSAKKTNEKKNCTIHKGLLRHYGH